MSPSNRSASESPGDRSLDLRPVAYGLLLGAACLASSCRSGGDASFSDWDDWQAEREADLRSETGYLALAGLHWLEVGEFRLGSAVANDMVLPPGAPSQVGTLHVGPDVVTLSAVAGVPLEHDGEPASTIELLPDSAADGPTRVALGELTLWVIERGGRRALRLRDPESPVLASYAGTPRFAPEEVWRVPARFERLSLPAPIAVPNVLGSTYPATVLGSLRFTLDATEHVLEVTGESEDGLFVIFGDATNGSTTYGGGRFLDVPQPGADGVVVIDFNRAYNPPCAYSPFTTCPLPPAGNRLPLPIPAGERVPH